MLLLVLLLFWAQVIDIATADRLFNQGRYEAALEAYQQHLKRLPDEPALLLRIGFCQYSLDQFDKAEATFRRVLSLAPGMPQAQVGLGSVLTAAGRAEEAIPLLEEAVKKLDGDVQARRALGRAYLEAGKFIEGEETLRALVEENPRDWQSWFYLGVLLFDQNYSAPALAALEKSLALHPDNPIALVYRAGALSQLGRLDEAEKEFRRLAANAAVNRSSEYFLGYGQLLFLKGDYAGALAKFEAAIERDPDSAKLHYWRARSLFYLKRIDEALKAAEKCVALAPNMPGGRNLLLRLYRLKGMEKEAAEQAAWLRAHEHKVAIGRGR